MSTDFVDSLIDVIEENGGQIAVCRDGFLVTTGLAPAVHALVEAHHDAIAARITELAAERGETNRRKAHEVPDAA